MRNDPSESAPKLRGSLEFRLSPSAPLGPDSLREAPLPEPPWAADVSIATESRLSVCESRLPLSDECCCSLAPGSFGPLEASPPSSIGLDHQDLRALVPADEYWD
eukprot:CAMPEP_0184308174 /NCGR_PEP_ID=MMETSP1049-20130417/16697_1 /TAXON_ID=77928 /ORGANISM="Proteomonas sulcata, Strain CCMP704" /LENGTH=104 /DNA_ID=CAMNT_0026620807 /DNA_START=1048 /DNA_END=1362 /DNA_ORIENTATION=-